MNLICDRILSIQSSVPFIFSLLLLLWLNLLLVLHWPLDLIPGSHLAEGHSSQPFHRSGMIVFPP